MAYPSKFGQGRSIAQFLVSFLVSAFPERMRHHIGELHRPDRLNGHRLESFPSPAKSNRHPSRGILWPEALKLHMVALLPSLSTKTSILQLTWSIQLASFHFVEIRSSNASASAWFPYELTLGWTFASSQAPEDRCFPSHT